MPLHGESAKSGDVNMTQEFVKLWKNWQIELPERKKKLCDGGEVDDLQGQWKVDWSKEEGCLRFKHLEMGVHSECTESVR